MAETRTTARVMLLYLNLHDAITVAHATVLGQVGNGFRAMDNTFEQHWCAKAESLFPAPMEEFPELCRCFIVEMWKQPFYFLFRQTPDTIFLDSEGGRAVATELSRTDDLEPDYWRERKSNKERKYAALLQAITRCTGFSEVAQATLVAGIRGSLNEQ